MMTEDIYHSGTTYTAYRERLLRAGGIMRELLEESEASLTRTEIDLEPFRRLTKSLRVLVLSEDWCGDCTDNLPILNRIAEESGKLDIRIVHRDEHLAIMEQHLKYGKYRSIPLIIFLDDEWNEIGCLIERPERVTELRQRKRQEVYDRHPEFGTPHTPPSELSDEMRAALDNALWRARLATRPFAIQEVVRELSAIAVRAERQWESA